jgi:hypothetical protein
MDIHSEGAAEILALAAQHRERKARYMAEPNPLRRKTRIAEYKFNSCQRKRKYTRDMALLAVRNMRRNNNAACDAYHCKLCNGWHVGGVQPHGEDRR